MPLPAAAAGDDYPGYPLIADATATLAWFIAGLPLAIVLTWLWMRRPPRIDPAFIKHTTQEESHAIQ